MIASAWKVTIAIGLIWSAGRVIIKGGWLSKAATAAVVLELFAAITLLFWVYLEQGGRMAA
jgi:hypothetical protein